MGHDLEVLTRQGMKGMYYLEAEGPNFAVRCIPQAFPTDPY